MIKANKTFFQIISLIICVLAIGIPFFVSHFSGKNYDKAIRKNSSITLGTVYGYEQINNKNSPVLKFEFEFEGKKYYSSSSCTETSLANWEDSYKKLFEQVKGKSFPVFFSKDNPNSYNKILITPGDFNEFNIKYPDSLNWVKTFLGHY